MPAGSIGFVRFNSGSCGTLYWFSVNWTNPVSVQATLGAQSSGRFGTRRDPGAPPQNLDLFLRIRVYRPMGLGGFDRQFQRECDTLKRQFLAFVLAGVKKMACAGLRLLVGCAIILSLAVFPMMCQSRALDHRPFTVVDTGIGHCYGPSGAISCPERGKRFFGQDAQYIGNQPAYKDNGDGTVTDLNTGLMWQKTPDFIKRSWEDAAPYARSLDLAGYKDWRLPTIKELFSLADFRGNIRARRPYIDTRYFAFQYPDTSAGYRIIDAQYWSSNVYVGLAMNGIIAAFGFNFADGRIKAYPVKPHGRVKPRDLRYVRCVRGPQYRLNDFRDNGDGTITDRATGLMWMKKDSGRPMNWAEALAYAENLSHAGYTDWRLPNVKELQTVVDYRRAPDARPPAPRGPAIDPVFDVTKEESWYWSSTPFIETGGACYVAFGQAFSAWKWRGKLMNAHGAGAVRSDPKQGNPAAFLYGRGPQGDQIRIDNYVRCVRGGTAKLVTIPPGSEKLPKEPRRGLPALGPGGPQAGFIRRLDRNGDGKVSRSEFDGPPMGFTHFDRNRDGFISANEAPKGPPPGRRGGSFRRPRPPGGLR
jgi:hypothetical protein